MIQYIFGIKSMSQTIKEIEVNIAYRWYLGYGMTEPIPHFSTFGKNYARRFEGTDLFEDIFKTIVAEIARDREAHGKKPLKEKETIETKTIKVSTTDAECGVFHKGEHKKVFAYTSNTACDRNNYILRFEVAPGNTHDSVSFPSLYNKLIQKYADIKNVVVDTGYKTPALAPLIIESEKNTNHAI